MRLDFVQRQKQWEAEQARSAPLLPSDAPEEEDEALALPISSNTSSTMQFSAPSTQWQATQEEADEVAQREREELEALLSFLPGEEMGVSSPQAQYQDYQSYHQTPQTEQADEQMSEHFGSDDDDYDALFSDFINAEAHEAAEGDAQLPESSGDAMDMS